jgi:hypothetical protein
VWGTPEGLIKIDICREHIGAILAPRTMSHNIMQDLALGLPSFSQLALVMPFTHLFIILIPNLATDIPQFKGDVAILDKELSLHLLIVKL